MRRSFIAALGVFVVLVAPAAASAAGNWFPRGAFASTQTQNGLYPLVQVGPDGTVYVAYRDGRGLSGGGQFPGRVAVRTRTPNGMFSVDQQLVQPGSENGQPLGLEVAPSGVASVLWNDNVAPPDLFLRRFTREGFLSPTITLSEPGGGNVTDARLGGYGAGNSIAVWRDGATNRLRLRRVAANGTASPGLFITAVGENPQKTALVAGADGTAAVAYLGGSGLYFRTVSPSGVVGPRELIAPAGNLSAVRIGRASNGAVQVAWWDITNNLVNLRGRSASGGWSAREPVGIPGIPSSSPDLAVAPDGSSAIVWLEETSSARVLGRRRTPGAGLGPAAVLAGPSSGTGYDPPQVLIEQGGIAVVAWLEATATSRFHIARGFRTDSSVDPRTLVSEVASSGSGDSIDIGADGLGNTAVAVMNVTTHKVDVTMGDFGGPEHRAVTAPATVERGVASTFAFTAVDRNGVASAGWRFPDDGTAPDRPTVSHTFAKAGSFAVRAVARDPFGNVREAVHAVRVVDTRRPGIRSLRLKRAKFRLGKKPVARTAAKKRRRARASTALTYRLSEDATVTVKVERRTTGRRKGKRCVKRTRKSRKRRRCTRYVATKLPRISRRQKAGKRSVVFTGKVGKRRLAAGRYRFVVQATDPSGNRSARVRKSFRVVR